MFERELAAPADQLSRTGVLAAKEWLKNAVGALDPQVLEAGFAAFLVDQLAEMERCVRLGRLWPRGGWLLRGRGGEPVTTRLPSGWPGPRSPLWVRRRACCRRPSGVAELPETEQALREGKLSQGQARRSPPLRRWLRVQRW